MDLLQLILTNNLDNVITCLFNINALERRLKSIKFIGFFTISIIQG